MASKQHAMAHLSRRDLLRHTAATAIAAATARTMLGAPAMAANRTPIPTGTALAHVRPRTTAQRALLARLDDTHTTFDDGTVEVLLWDGDRARLDAVSMDYDLVRPAEARSLRPAALGPQPGETPEGEYRLSSARYEADLRTLVEAHADSGRVRLLEMPTPSLLGTRVYGVEIATDVASDDGRPVVMHDGMHHCREWPAGEMPMMWAHELLENYGTDPNITAIVDNARTIILPLVNPDGFDRTTGAAAITGQTDDIPLALVGLGDQWRKNVRAVTTTGPGEPLGPTIGGSPVGAQQPDAYGIDLNRNYPFLWGDEMGSSSVPADQTYRGTAPFSEPESHNVRDLVRAHLPVTHITHHTSGQQMLIPWGRDPEVIRSPDWPLMKAIAEEMRDGWTDAEGSDHEGNGYEAIQAFGLYPTSGTSRDYGHACTRTIIYTFEHGRQFHEPYPSTVPQMYARNRSAFIRHSLAAIDPQVHGRITGTGPAGGTVEVTKTFQTPTHLQLAGVPVVNSPVAPPSVEDPTADTLRPSLVEETISRTVQLGADGSFDVRVPPSTRPFIVNEQLLEGFEPGDTEAYTLILRDVDGNEVGRREVTVDRGETVEA